MAAVCSAIADLSRKNETAILRGLAEHSQSRIAEQIGVNDSTISRFKDGGLAQAAALLAACGLKVVKTDRICVDVRRYEAMCTLAQAALSCNETAQRLIWDDQS